MAVMFADEGPKSRVDGDEVGASLGEEGGGCGTRMGKTIWPGSGGRGVEKMQGICCFSSSVRGEECRIASMRVCWPRGRVGGSLAGIASIDGCRSGDDPSK